MKIAIILDAFPALSETFVLSQITGLMDLGHDVQIFPAWHTSPSKMHEDVVTYGLMARTHAIPPTPRNKFVRLLAAAGIFARGIFTQPVRTFRLLRLVMNGPRPRDFSLRHLYFFSRFPDGFDVLHCHYGYNGLLAVDLRSLGVKGAIGTVFHGHDIFTGDDYQRLFEQGDVFLPISERWKSWLIEHGCPADKTFVHHMGIDLEKFPFKPRSAALDEEVRILSVARLVPIKGLDYLLRALAKVVPAHPRVSLTIAGDGPVRGELESLAHELKLDVHVRFLGAVEQGEIRRLMGQSHILVQPSITTPDGAQEGIPMVLMEAMASGLPVITTDYSCMPELVDQGVSGYLVPERDIDGIAAKLTLLVENTASWASMGQAGRTKVAQFYSVRTLNSRLAEIYSGPRGS
jgi:colanic acid/amylovoran biosynthesis glycosyltransferase